MHELTISGNAVTMTSLELVAFINEHRNEGEAELRHRDFTAKVPKVLGDEMCEKFRTSLKDAYGRDQPGFTFPKREACLMAMSYSYDIQAKVFDRMTSLEAKVSAPALPAADVRELADRIGLRQVPAQEAGNPSSWRVPPTNTM